MNSALLILTKIEKWVAGLAIFIMTILVLTDIAAREIFHSAIPWAQKSAVYFMIWSGFLGAILTSQKASHLRPEMADKLWGEEGKFLFLRLQNGFTFIFCLLMSYLSIFYVLESFEFGDMNVIIGIRIWILQIVIPYTFLSMGLRHLYYCLFPHEVPKKDNIH